MKGKEKFKKKGKNEHYMRIVDLKRMEIYKKRQRKRKKGERYKEKLKNNGEKER